jgi:hypothetical protein
MPFRNRATLWTNTGSNGEFTNTVVEHCYKDRNTGEMVKQKASVAEKYYGALADGFAKAAEMVEARKHSQGQSANTRFDMRTARLRAGLSISLRSGAPLLCRCFRAFPP